MMTCEVVRERFLEASAAELAGRGESAVARHVRNCAACHAVARRILDETERLEGSLEDIHPRMTAEEAARLAFEGWPAAARGPIAARGTGSRGVTRRWRRWAPVPIAVAAGIAALVLTVGPRGQRLEESGPSARAMREATIEAVSPEGLSVDIPEEGGVAVFETTNPTITVVWFY